MNDHDDIDAQFRDLVAGLEDSDGSLDAAEGPDAGGRPAEDGRDADDIPVDESLHLEGGRLSVGLVLAPISSPEALHSLLSLTGIRESVVRLKPWTGVWLRVETRPTAEDEFDDLLADTKPMPEAVDAVARVVSRLSKYGAVALMSWLVEGEGAEPGVSGRITAQRYVAGRPEDPIPAGVLLGAMPQAAEDLLLGRTRPGDYGDSVSSQGARRRPGGPIGWFTKRRGS
ncbi:hypothetical protein M3T53_05145 [Actinomyces sp. B33]|uniref:hypothetical protein n=1 Tax=Actinomyces sp. B33 TaxID=2942131 RepID=UPI002341CFAA|nr:hypothetical protein [Actinomyces sp. B33]MDC4233098.1 hypothetical protein [Actinomyces sp. B33]